MNADDIRRLLREGDADIARRVREGDELVKACLSGRVADIPRFEAHKEPAAPRRTRKPRRAARAR